MESSFIADGCKFLTGALTAMTCMIRLEVSHINILSKMDLIEGRPGELLVKNTFGQQELEQSYEIDPTAPKSGYANTWDDQELEIVERKRDLAKIDLFLQTDTSLLMDRMGDIGSDYSQLNKAVIGLLDDYGLVKFHPLNIHDEDSINAILYVVDQSLQYGDDVEPREPRDQDFDDFEDE